MKDWTDAHAKVVAEGSCRVGGQLHGYCDPAHIIQRSRIPGPEGMDARNIVPLCRSCHRAYDTRDLDLLPYLTVKEQGYAASLVGVVAALERTTNRRWGPA